METRLVDPTGTEPGLVVELRDERRTLLFDAGPPIQALVPRVLLRVSHVFVTHTHMDHFAGLDHLLALGLGRVARLVLWGGPGFVDQVEHKLRAYTWNVVHRYAVPMVIEAHGLEQDGTRHWARFDSKAGFARTEAGTSRHPEPDGGGKNTAAPGSDAPAGHAAADVLLDDPLFRVRACFVDHEMPVLAFALEEKAQLRVAADRIAAMGLATGPWLSALKQAVLAGAPDDMPLMVQRCGGPTRPVERLTVGALRPLVLDAVPGRRIGYVTDLRYTPENLGQLRALLADADLLHIESVFLDCDRDHARRKNHLTARQAGEIAGRLRARRVVPFHFSPRYRGDEALLRAEVDTAWRTELGG